MTAAWDESPAPRVGDTSWDHPAIFSVSWDAPRSVPEHQEAVWVTGPLAPKA